MTVIKGMICLNGQFLKFSADAPTGTVYRDVGNKFIAKYSRYLSRTTS